MRHIIMRVIATDTGAELVAISSARRRATSSSSSAGCSDRTRPAGQRLGRREHPGRVAPLERVWMPTMRGRNQLEAASGTMPRAANTNPNRRVGRREPDVHRQRHGRPDADGGPVDGGDHGLGAPEDPQGQHPAGVAQLAVDADRLARRRRCGRLVALSASAASGLFS